MLNPKDGRENDEEIIAKTADARQIYRERIDSLIKGAEIENISDRARRERIKKMLAYSLEGIAREKQGADADAVYREVKTCIELMRDMARGLANDGNRKN